MLAGCATWIPAKVEVKDVGTGQTFTTYEPWGRVEKGVGYVFTDIESGRRITLTSYETKPLEKAKSVSPTGAEAKAFESAKARGGVK